MIEPLGRAHRARQLGLRVIPGGFTPKETPVRLRIVLFTAFILVLSAWACLAQDLVGTVTHVRDADTIEVDGVPIRLQNIDAPELGTTLGDAGKRWVTERFLGRRVECYLNGERTYDRWVGHCHDGGTDIGLVTIAAGYAVWHEYHRPRVERFEPRHRRHRRRH